MVIEIGNIISKFNKNLVYGRILKGRNSEDFSTLTYRPRERFVVMLMGYDGLNNINNLSAEEALQKIGYTKEYINSIRCKGFRLKLAVFEEKGAMLATWDNLIKLVSLSYPRQGLEEYISSFKSLTYNEILQAGGRLSKARIFLKETLNILPSFSGTGITSGGIKEYIILNKAIAELGKHYLIDIT